MNRLEALNYLRDKISEKSVSLIETVLFEFIATNSTKFETDDIIHLCEVLIRIQFAESDLVEALNTFDDLNEKVSKTPPLYKYPSLDLSPDFDNIGHLRQT